MSSIRVNPNISYASVASGKIITKNLPLLPPLPAKNYTFSSPYQQRFPLPYDVMKYILRNPKSSDSLLKLYKTCKYFYSKQQILIVSGKVTFDIILSPTCIYENKTNFKRIKKPQLWFINDLILSGGIYFFDFTKVYRSTIKSIIIFGQKLTINEFKLLVAEKTIESFTASYQCEIVDSNDERVSVDVILPLLPNINKFWYFINREKYSKETLKKLNAIKMKNKFQQFLISLGEVSEDFDANLLFEFIQKNSDSQCKIYLVPWIVDREAILLKLTAAEEKFKTMKEWNDKKFVLSYSFPA